MTTHPHLEGLIRKWRNSSQFWRENGTEYGESSAITFADCAEELEAMLATLAEKQPPLPDPVIVAELDRDDEFRHVKAYTAEQMQDYAKAALAALPGGGVGGIDWKWQYRFQTVMRFMDNGMTREMADKAADADVAGLERIAHTAALTPTPNPHEADRNG